MLIIIINCDRVCCDFLVIDYQPNIGTLMELNGNAGDYLNIYLQENFTSPGKSNKDTFFTLLINNVQDSLIMHYVKFVVKCCSYVSKLCKLN